MGPGAFLELAELGRGASGSVHCALHVLSWTVVALKSISVDRHGGQRQLLNELNAFDSLEHSNLVGYYGSHFEEGRATLVLEFVDRGSLQGILDLAGPLDEPSLRDVARQVLRALAHINAHRRMHRDVKPSNLLVTGRGVVKISDFGISGRAASDAQSVFESFVGTAVYMSPERIAKRQYGYSADVWSLGLVLVTCATGRCPVQLRESIFSVIQAFEDDRLADIGPGFSPACRNFVAQCLTRDPDQRPTPAVLLGHPFVSGSSDDGALAAFLDRTPVVRERSLRDLDVMLGVIAERLFVAPGRAFLASAGDRERFARLSAQFGFTEAEVARRFELRLAALRRAKRPPSGGGGSGGPQSSGPGSSSRLSL